MLRCQSAVGLFAVGFLLLPSPLRADRVPSSKVQNQPSTGSRPSIVVPYITNSNGNLGVYQGVAPRIYKSPIVDDPRDPQSRPVYNIPFYGAVQAFGDRSDGATPRSARPIVPR